MTGGPEPLVRLGTSRWGLWPEAVLRGAGFPAAGVLALGDPDLAAAADAAAKGGPAGGAVALPDEAWRLATERLSTAIRGFAADPRFREAVTWQNRRLLRDCLDKARAGEPRNVRGRNHELAVTSYAQRYHVKNDTIGFFGPVGWARITGRPGGLTVTAGPELLARRTTYLEVWAVDAIAEALAADPAVRPWLRPRRVAANLVDGRTVHVPNRPPLRLPDGDTELLTFCDGTRSGREIAAELAWSGHDGLDTEEGVLAALDRLRVAGLLHVDLEGPVEAYPEATLRDRLAAIPDPPLRERLLSTLESFVALRDEVGAAAGDADRLAAAIDRTNAAFETITRTAAVRRHGRTYAGRTVLYEDTVRDARVEVGAGALAVLADPLALLLDSAAWLVGAAAERYRALLDRLFDRARERAGAPWVPLAMMVSLATPHLFFSLRHLPGPVADATAELQRRWTRILRPPADTSRHRVRAADIADRVRAEFPVPPPAWSSAVHHAPDVMVAAAGPAAAARGELLGVLGELHLASNTVESRLFVEQHEDPARLRALDAADHGGRRVYLVPPKDWPVVNSRTYPPSALLSPGYRYWSLHPDSGGVPARVDPVAGLSVHRRGDRLVVRHRTRGDESDLLEVLGELLSAAVVNGFRPLPPAPHRPRVAIDRLVIARESWTFPAAELAWTAIRDERRRYLAGRAWRIAQAIPERAFYTVPVEDKPLYVDFTGISLVNLFAKAVRRAAEHAAATVSITEMLPDVHETWLVDAEGAGYTAELRLVAVDLGNDRDPNREDA